MGARKGNHGESGWNRKAELKPGVKMAGEGGPYKATPLNGKGSRAWEMRLYLNCLSR